MAAILFDRNDIDRQPNSLLKQVTVSESRARIVRTLKARPDRKSQAVFFSALGRGIEESTIKARVVQGNARILSVSLEKQNLYFYNKEENEKLASRTASSLRRLIELFDQKTVLAVEAGLIACLREYLERALGDVLLEQNVAITRVKEALDFLRQLLDRNREDAVTGDRAEEEAQEEYTRLSTLLHKAGQLDRRETHRIRVELESGDEQEIETEVTYTIPGVSWRMAYDAALQVEKKDLLLSVYAEIKQTTGEAWEGADIVLSSVDSVTGIGIPAIHPVHLSGYEEKISRDVTTVEEDIDEIPEEGEGAGPHPVEKPDAGPEKQGTAYAFTITHPPAVPSDGLWHRLLIRREQCTSRLSWETVPAKMEYVYLKAAFTNQSGAPLLPGRVMIYRNGSYIGATTTPYRADGEECALSFGIDLDIKVKRLVIKDHYHRPRGLSNRARREYVYQYMLSHYKDETVTLILKEPVHLSEVEKIKVRIEEDTSPGYKKDREGVVCFETTVPAKKFEQTRLKLHYSVEGPAAYGLDRI